MKGKKILIICMCITMAFVCACSEEKSDNENIPNSQEDKVEYEYSEVDNVRVDLTDPLTTTVEIDKELAYYIGDAILTFYFGEINEKESVCVDYSPSQNIFIVYRYKEGHYGGEHGVAISGEDGQALAVWIGE